MGNYFLIDVHCTQIFVIVDQVKIETEYHNSGHGINTMHYVKVKNVLPWLSTETNASVPIRSFFNCLS